MTRGSLAGLALAAMLVAGCFTTHDILAGPTWALGQVNGAPPAAAGELVFSTDGTFRGTIGLCPISGRYHLDGNRIEAELDPQEAISCGGAVDAQVVTLLTILGSGPAYAIDTGTGHLRITADDGQFLLYAAP